MITIRVSS